MTAANATRNHATRDVVRDWVAQHAMATPKKTALIDHAGGRVYSYAEFHDRVSRVAGCLAAQGVGKGDRVGFYALNSTDILEIVFGCWRVGAVALALNFRLTPAELAFIIKDSSPLIVFHDLVFEKQVGELKQQTDVGAWIALDGVGGDTPYEEEIARAEGVTAPVEKAIADQALLMYSSGTTGRPKGVIITHEMLLYSAVNLLASTQFTAESVNLAVMPMFHIGGFNIFASPAVYAGATSLVMRSFDPGAVLDALGGKFAPVSHFIGVPAMYNAMRAHPNAQEADFSRIVVACAGAEAVPQPLVRWWLDRGLTIQEGYGMTESAASNTLLTKADMPKMIGSAGKPAMHSEMKIARDDGSEAAPGEIGEIWMRGPCITPGYWKRPEANIECFEDGWFKSGDLGRKDADGFYYIEDRKKDMYISGGENVYPAEVENVIYGHPDVGEVAVIGVADAQWGEAGCAVIAPKDDAAPTAVEIAAFCADKLARFKIPKHVMLVEALPRNASGKVLKFELREQAAGVLNPDAD